MNLIRKEWVVGLVVTACLAIPLDSVAQVQNPNSFKLVSEYTTGVYSNLFFTYTKTGNPSPMVIQTGEDYSSWSTSLGGWAGSYNVGFNTNIAPPPPGAFVYLQGSGISSWGGKTLGANDYLQVDMIGGVYLFDDSTDQNVVRDTGSTLSVTLYSYPNSSGEVTTVDGLLPKDGNKPWDVADNTGTDKDGSYVGYQKQAAFSGGLTTIGVYDNNARYGTFGFDGVKASNPVLLGLDVRATAGHFVQGANGPVFQAYTTDQGAAVVGTGRAKIASFAGKIVTTNPPPTVPEASSIILLAFGGLPLLALRRRRA